jgi:hypothetical protein
MRRRFNCQREKGISITVMDEELESLNEDVEGLKVEKGMKLSSTMPEKTKSLNCQRG